jgi:excisionase family DNA binding protein
LDVMADQDELLTVAEIAATLKMNQQSIRNWIDSGYLPAIRIGRRVRVKRSDFDALLEASYTGTKPRTRTQPPAGFWDGNVPAPVLPGENVEHAATPPDAPGDAGEA